MELLDVYDSGHRRTGRRIQRGREVFSMERLLVVHVCILNGSGEMLIQKRRLSKEHYPGCWDLTAGGFVLSGEDSADAALRELREEIGLTLSPNEIRFLFTEPFSFVLDDYYLARYDVSLSALKLQSEEVSEAAWASQHEIEAMILDGRFVDYPLSGIQKVFRIAAEAIG